MKSFINKTGLILCLIGMQMYAQNIKPYHEVITSKAVTQKGFLTTHLLDNKLYLEIPEAMLGKDMLFVDHSDLGLYPPHHIKFIKKADDIHLIIPEITSKVGNTIPLIKIDDGYGVRHKLNVKIAPAAFPVLAMGATHSSYIIEVSSLFLHTPKPLHGHDKTVYNNLAYIKRVWVFNNTLEVKTNKTIVSKYGPLTEDIDFSLFLLPETPMKPRLFDHRMGFFRETDIGLHDMVRAAIQRWRLEKKDKNQALSDPVKPIVLYFDPITPEKWKPYLRAGVEAWLPAFEAAGFKNAIVVKEPPVDDENFSVYSMRYSIIRWTDRTNYRGYEGGGTANGLVIWDRRTGEILKGDLLIGAPYELLSDQYFVRCSPLDKRAQQYPFPDDLMGDLIQSVTSHEAGHVFGLRDGNFGEYTYPFEKMRDAKWLKKMGHTPSIMTYARANGLVQPEDNIPISLLLQKVGPTDIHSIRWAYTPFPNIETPDDELPYLDKIISEQDAVPWYKFSMPHGFWNGRGYGPDDTVEVVECDDPVRASRLAIKNLKRVITLIPKAAKDERGHGTLKRLYEETLKQWRRQMHFVASLVGGCTTEHKAGYQDRVFRAIPKDDQKEAVAFLIKEAFHPPLWLESPEITRRYEMNGTLKTISKHQKFVLNDLLYPRRLNNMEEVAITSKESYTQEELFQDLYIGLWHELEEKTIKIDPYRQDIQWAYINSLKLLLEAQGINNSNTRANMFSALALVKESIGKVVRDVTDFSTRGHLELCLKALNEILE